MVWNGIRPMRNPCFFTLYCLFEHFCALLYLESEKITSPGKISTTTAREGRDKFHVWSECDFIFPQPTCFQHCWQVCCRSMTNWLPIHFYQEVPRLSLYLVGYGIFIFHISKPRCVGCATGTWDLGGPAWKALTNNQPPGISCFFCIFLPHF